VSVGDGSGALNGLNCHKDSDCATGFNAVKDLTGGAKVVSCDIGSKTCMFAHRSIQGWKAMSCETDADCKTTEVVSGLSCKNFMNAWEISPEYGPSTGQTTVTIIGDQISNTAHLQCKFKDRSGGVLSQYYVDGLYLNSTALSCLTPAVLDPSTAIQEYSLELTQDGQTFTTSNLTFYYYKSAITVSDFSPRSGTLSGGTEILVTGTGFVDSNQGVTGAWIRCIFGELFVAATYISPTALTCVSPASGVIISTEFRISFSGGDNRIANTGLSSAYGPSTYRFYPSTVSLSMLSPSHGLITGDTTVTVAGTGFDPTGSITLDFGGFVTTGVYVTSTSVVCKSPGVNLTAWDNNHAFNLTTDGIGPLEGSGGRREVLVRIALNAKEYSLHTTKYWVYDMPNVTKLEPTSGPQYGGTMITIHGENFVGGNIKNYDNHEGFLEPKVRFVSGSPPITNEVLGTWKGLEREDQNSEDFEVEQARYVIVCYTPVSIQVLSETPPPAKIQVSLNGDQWNTTYAMVFNYSGSSFTTVPAVNFVYYPSPVRVVEVVPSLGPITGGTVVTVKGLNLTETGEILCRFGYTRKGYLYQADLGKGAVSSSDPNKVICTSPNVETTYDWAEQRYVKQFQQNIELNLALNGQQYTDNKVNFLFHPSWANTVVSKVLPTKGGARGGTGLTIYGQNFVASSYAKCQFVSAADPNTVLGTTTATYQSFGQITCPSPTLTGVQWVASGSILCEILSNETSSGYALAASTTVMSTGMLTTCAAGTEDRCHFTQGISLAQKNCVSILKVQIKVSFDGQLFSPTSAAYTFLGHPNIISITPTSTANDGGSKISIAGHSD